MQSIASSCHVGGTLPADLPAMQSTLRLAGLLFNRSTVTMHSKGMLPTPAVTCRDFGVLSESDERCYITAMVASGQAISAAGSSGAAAAGATFCSLLDKQLLVKLLCTSQTFIRSSGQKWDVSLRDVKRCIKLARYGTVV
jgi:hypothetical protein